MNFHQIRPPINIKIFILRYHCHVHKSKNKIVKNDQPMPQMLFSPYRDQATNKAGTSKTDD